MIEIKFYIPNDIKHNIDKKEYFLLVRPFLSAKGWVKKGEMFDEWKLDKKKIIFTKNLKEASAMLIPYSINYFFENKITSCLENYNNLCQKFGIFGFGYISGDYPTKYKEYEKLIYFRMGGFKSKLSSKNKGFPAALTDQYPQVFNTKKILINKKKTKPIVGFCGLATNNWKVLYKQRLIHYFDQIKNNISFSHRKGFQPLFISSEERYKLLKSFEKSKLIDTNFIFREKYRAGAKSEEDFQKTTKEYYSNIVQSDYVLCLRGYGNFSIRFYETLMMGRIPILLDTDCLLPFPELINWKNHTIFIDWNDRKSISKIVSTFHKNISRQSFEELQIKNRFLWMEKLKPKWILENLI